MAVVLFASFSDNWALMNAIFSSALSCLQSLSAATGIQAYGLAICLGLILGVKKASQHPWCANPDAFMRLINSSILVGIIGARLLHILSESDEYASVWDMLQFWSGGLSSWGTVISLVLFVPLYASHLGLPPLQTLDLCALYAPLVQSISRLGCFAAGCCGGLPCAMLAQSWGIMAHPTQLYSAALLFIAWLIMTQFISRFFSQPGMALTTYLFFAGFERFVVDWWRNDRLMHSATQILSLHQEIALLIMLSSAIGWVLIQWSNSHEYEHI